MNPKQMYSMPRDIIFLTLIVLYSLFALESLGIETEEQKRSKKTLELVEEIYKKL